MSEFIMNAIIWTLALYGLFEIIKEIIYMYTYTKFKSDGTYLLVVAKNQENSIENFLRTVVFKIIYGKEEKLKKMSEDNECLKCVSWKECKDIIDNINEK